MKLYKKISITILSLMLVFACGFLVSDIYNPSKQKVFASGGDYKYFYLSDMESSSKTSNITFYRNSSYVTMQRGSGLAEETFVKNFVIVNNGSVTYDLRGLNAERFVAYVGIDNTTGRSGTSNLVVQVDGVTKSSLDTLNSNNRYQYVDISLTNATKITFTVSNASSGAWTVLANPRVFGTNLLTGYTQTKPLELSNLPVAYGYPIAPNAVDVKIRENNTNTIRLTSCSGANSTNPAKLGFNIEGISAYYFTTSVIRYPHPTSGALSSPKIMIQKVASAEFEDLIPIGETKAVMQDTTETVVYSYIIPADTAILILATYGFDSTFVNPTLYCNNYIDLTTHPRASSDVASESITTPASLNYYINKTKTNTIAQFNKYILTHPHGDRVGYITFASDDTHATRFTAYIGVDSDVASNTTYPSDGVKFSFKAYNYFTGQEEILYPETTINYSSYRDNGLMYYVDVNLPKGTSSITLTVDKNGNNWSDHAIWCAPMLFGNNISLYSTTIGKWQADSSGHYRKDTVNNSNAYFEAHQYSHDCDNTCNTEGCGYTRTTSHKFDNACDTTCNTIGCGYTRTITHTWATEWSADANNHWKDCIVCHNAKTQTETHSFSEKTDDNNHWQECDICKYQKEISAHGNWHYNVVDDNTHSKQCGNCTYIKNEEHSFCNWYVESYASNENKTDGVERRDCLLCSYFERRDMQANNKASLSLKETIGLNLYIDATKYTADANAYVELTYNHNSTSYVPYYTTDVIYLNQLVPDNDNLYKFSMSFASGQIADTISLKLYNGQKNLLYSKMDYSILEYCQNIINDVNQTDNELKNLCKAIINYGITSINYFDYSTNLANPNSYKQTIEGVAQEISNVPNATIEQGAKYLSISRFTFITLSDTSIRVYFDTSGFIFNDNYVVTLTKPTSVDTEMSYKTGVNDYGYFVEVYGIESANIDKLFTITISFKGDEQNKTIITYSALNYLKEKEQDVNSSSLLKELCVAIYQYNICAKNYFENN